MISKKVLVLMASGLFFSACSSNKNVPADTHISELNSDAAVSAEIESPDSNYMNPFKAMEQSRRVLDAFRNRNWQQIRDISSPTVASGLTDDVLSELWNKTAGTGGDYVDNAGLLPHIIQKYLVVDAVERFRNTAVSLRMTWNGDEKLDGFFAVSQDVPACPESCTLDAASAVHAFLSGDRESLMKRASEAFRQALTQELLDTSREQVMDLAGNFIAMDSISLIDKSKNIYQYVGIFDKASVTFNISFDDTGLLTGLVLGGLKNNHQGSAQVQDKSFNGSETPIQVVTGNIKNDGLLSLPVSVEKPPVVILLQGSGCSDMNETIMANAPFKDIAHDLADRGVAAIRYNKRCIAEPASVKDIQSEYLDDLDSAISLAKSLDTVDTSRIFVLGHSLAGSLIPFIAVKHPELSGGIAVSGSLRSLHEISLDQNKVLIEEYKKSLTGDALKTLEQQEKDVLQEFSKFSEIDKMNDDDTLVSMPVHYWKSVLATTGRDYIARVNMPVLVLQGAEDRQVYPDRDYVLWSAAAQTQSNIECRLFPGLNHLMMPAVYRDNLTFTRDYEKPSHVAAEVVDAIAEFVNRKN